MDIMSRKTGLTGKPALITTSNYGKLSKTQKFLLNSFRENSIVQIDKISDNISLKMKDLSCLTAYSGLEYSLFSRNDRQYLVAGTKVGIHVDEDLSNYLIKNHYKWTGHTHYGTNDMSLLPSDADYETLHKFNQKRSIIYNSIGKYYIFGEEE